MADIAPLPKDHDIEDFNKDLRLISLTSNLSKIAEDFIIQHDLKPTLLNIIDPKLWFYSGIKYKVCYDINAS